MGGKMRNFDYKKLAEKTGIMKYCFFVLKFMNIKADRSFL